MNPYFIRGGVTLLGLVIGYLLTTTPLIGGHLDAASFTILFAILLGMLVG